MEAGEPRMVTDGLAAADIATPTATAATTVAGRAAWAIICRIVLRATECSLDLSPAAVGGRKHDAGWVPPDRQPLRYLLACERVRPDSPVPPGKRRASHGVNGVNGAFSSRFRGVLPGRQKRGPHAELAE